MRQLRRWPICLAAGLMVLAAMAVPVRAQLETPPIVGIIDIQGVLRESLAVQALSREVEELRAATQDELVAREEALRAADIDLAQRRASLTPEAYAEERERLEAEGIDLQRQLQERRRALDQRFSQGMAQVQQVLLQIAQDIARDNNLDLVLAKTTVIIVRSEFDFTAEALRRLNAELTEITLPPIQN